MIISPLKPHVSQRILLAVFVLLGLVLRGPSLRSSWISTDEAEYATAAAVILNGGIPYRDVVIHHPPLIYYVYAFVFFFFGAWNLLPVHLLFCILVIFNAWVLGRIVGRFGPRDGWGWPWAICLFIWAASALRAKDALAANAELLVNLFLSLSAYFSMIAASRRRAMGQWAFAGICFGLALSAKLHAVFFLPAVATLMGTGLKKGRLSSAVFSFGLGTLLVAGAWIGFFSSWGALSEFKRVVFDHALFYSALPWAWFKLNLPGYLTGNVRAFFQEWLYYFMKFFLRIAIVMICVPPLWWGVSKSKVAAESAQSAFPDPAKRHTLFLALWLMGQWFSLAVGGRYFWHYFLLLLPPAVLLAMNSYGSRLRSFAVLNPKKLGLLALTLIPLVAFQIEAWRSFFGSPSPAYKALITEIEQRTSREGKIFVWGFMPQIFFDARRLPASRFLHSDLLTGMSRLTPGQFPGSGDLLHRLLADFRGDLNENLDPPPVRPIPQAVWKELWEDLERDYAELWIDTSLSGVGNYHGIPPQSFPDLEVYLAEKYQAVGRVHNFMLYSSQK